jgi:hypothetical protein
MQTCPHCGTRLPGVTDVYCPNCGQALVEDASSAAPPVGSHLTGHEWGYLGMLRRFGRAGPTVAALYRVAIGPAVVYPLVVVGFALICFAMDRSDLGWLGVGVAAGVMLRDNGSFRRTVQVWGAVAAVTDWDRVAALAGGAEAKPTPEIR